MQKSEMIFSCFAQIIRK